MHGLLHNADVRWVKAAVAAANNTDSNSAIIDTQGAESIMFVVPVIDSVATGVATLKIEESDTNADGGMAAVDGAVATSVCAVNDDLNSKLLMVEYFRPRKRYVQAVITSGTANIAFGEMVAILTPLIKPVEQGETVLDTGFAQD